MTTILLAHLVDLHEKRIFPAKITLDAGCIAAIEPTDEPVSGYLLPGFVDAHVHIESSMLVPSEFARMAVVHGSVATVSDPHEIANVLGVPGVEFMLENAAQVPFKFHFGAPSCVPATNFETAGAVIGPEEVEQLLQRPDIWYLSEMMNFPGVIHRDPMVMAKIEAAHRIGKPVDGHAPALRGEALDQYRSAGITTDHEAFTYEEGLEKLQKGMKILIREGSAAKNFEALIDLLPQFPEQIMFCSDDKHPDDLIKGHINQLVKRALERGLDLFQVLRAACIHPVEHYRLPVGTLRPGDPADAILVDNLTDFNVLKTWINGELVADNGQSFIPPVAAGTPNNFQVEALSPADFAVTTQRTEAHIHVIIAEEGAIVTGATTAPARIERGCIVAQPERDILKIAVVNRYQSAPVACGFIQGFGLKSGALASCVAHDSHNIVAVGCSDEALCAAVNLVIKHRGGISAVGSETEKVLPLPVAGIMSNADGHTVAAAYSEIDTFVRQELGSVLTAPFMTLSFMALPVIPALKMTDKGLFDVTVFDFSAVVVER
jgi:adenine deaminase